jgi:ribosomal protein S18 acetylase RimI-like enzyme
LEKLINEARLQDGLEQLLLTVTQSNLAARQLYISAGFVRFGAEQNAIKIACTYYAKEYFALAF